MTTIYTETRIIALNSESALIYKNGNFNSNMLFAFSGLLQDDPNIIQRSITLSNAQLPVSFYIVNYTNNVFIIKNNTSGISYTITIPVGNYNSTQFISTITSLILTNASININITLDNTTGKLTFSSLTNYTFVNVGSVATSQMLFGFSNTANLISSLVSGSYVATCPFPLNLLGIKQLQIKSSIISATNFSSNSYGQDCVLATIPVNIGAWGMITYVSSTGTNISFNNTTLDEIDIRIVDAETNKDVNFNNIGWTMTFLLHITRRIDLAKSETDLRTLTNPINLKLPIIPEKQENPDLADLRLLEN